MSHSNINSAGAAQLDGVIGEALVFEGAGNVVAGEGGALVIENGANLVFNGDVNVPTITIQPGATITVNQEGINGPTDLIFSDHTLHIEAGHSLTHCTIEMVGDALNITPLDRGDVQA